jgi:TP901 family phage tail tape measure protein
MADISRTVEILFTATDNVTTTLDSIIQNIKNEADFEIDVKLSDIDSTAFQNQVDAIENNADFEIDVTLSSIDSAAFLNQVDAIENNADIDISVSMSNIDFTNFLNQVDAAENAAEIEIDPKISTIDLTNYFNQLNSAKDASDFEVSVTLSDLDMTKLLNQIDSAESTTDIEIDSEIKKIDTATFLQEIRNLEDSTDFEVNAKMSDLDTANFINQVKAAKDNADFDVDATIGKLNTTDFINQVNTLNDSEIEVDAKISRLDTTAFMNDVNDAQDKAEINVDTDIKKLNLVSFLADLQKAKLLSGGMKTEFDYALKSVNQLSTGMANFSGSILTAAAGITTMTTLMNAFAVAGIGLAVTKAGLFSDEMNTINTLLDVTDGQFQSFKDSVLDYSESSVLSLQDIELSLYNLISLGVDYKDSLQALSVIEQLAVGTKSTLNQATETLIGTMNAYGAEMDEAQDYSDSFFTIIKDGKTTLPELATSIADVTGIAAAAGIPFETLGAAIAAMTASGAPTAQAMTKIKAAIEGIINPTDSARKAAAELGIDLSATALEAKGFEGVLKEVYTATGGNIGQLAKLFTSTEALQAVLALGADEAGTFAKALKDMEANAGATDKAFAKMQDNLALIWQNLLNNFGSVVIKLGSQWEDSSKELIAAITATFQGLGASIDAGTFDDLVKLVDDIIKEITADVNEIAKNLPDALAGVDFSEFIASIQSIGEALGSSFEGLDLTSVEGLEAVFQTIIDVMGTMNEVTASIIESLQFVFDVIEQLIKPSEDASEAVKAVVDGIKTLGNAVELIIPFLDKFIAVWAVAFGAKTVGLAAKGIMDISKVLGIVGAALLGPTTALEAFSFALKGTLAVITGPAGLAIALGVLAKTVVDFSLAEMAKDSELASKAIAAQAAEVKILTDQIKELPLSTTTVDIWTAIDTGDLEKAQGLIDDIVNAPDSKKIDVTATVTKDEWDVFESDWNKLVDNPDVSLAITAAINEGDFDKVQGLLDGTIEANVEVKVDQPSKEQATQELQIWTESGGWETITVPVDTTGVDEAKAEIDSIPTDKQLEIKLQGDIDTQIALIETNAATLQSAFEWDAKLNIADVEAQAAIVESTFNSINTSINSTADLIGTALGTLNDPQGFQAKWEAQDILREEADLRQQSFDLQKKLTEAQVAQMEAKTKALQSGGAEISIDSSGLEPALEMVMWEILKKVQVRANENASDFLLGL